jgi:AcrR family transcriptional regulator
VRRDTEIRVARLDEPLAAAGSVDDVLDVLVSSLIDTIENEPGVFALLFEVFSAGRRNPEIQREVGDLFRRTRDHVAEVLEAKQKEGALGLQFGAATTASYLLAIADGLALQALSDPDGDFRPVIAAGRAAARPLLSSD